MTTRTCRISRIRYGAVIFFSMLLPFALPRADPGGGSDKAIISLSEYSDGVLIAASPRALVRIDTATRESTQISLPDSVERVAAVATPVNHDGRIYVAAAGSGVWRSADGGTSWTARNEGLPKRNVTALVSHAEQSDTLYAFVSGDGIYRSENAGDEWILVDGGPEEMTGAFVHSDMPDSMQTGWLFAATKAGVSRSMDCFCLWRDTGLAAGKVHALSYDPGEPAHVYAATDNGLYLSEDGGETWKNVPTPASTVTSLIVTSAGELFAGSANGAIYRSVDRGNSWESVFGR